MLLEMTGFALELVQIYKDLMIWRLMS